MLPRKFRRLPFAAALAASLLLGACASSDDRYEPAKLTSYTPGATISTVWSVDIGSGGGSGFVPAISGDAVYAATPGGTVSKVDLSSGRVIWSNRVARKLSAGVGTDGNIAVVVTPAGEIIALDGDGQEKWRAKASSEVLIPPVVEDGYVVVRSGDYRIQAFNADTGARLWSVQRPGPALALRAPTQMILVDGLLITGMPGGKMLVINAATGNVQWEGTVATPKGATDLERVTDVVGQPQVVGALLCAASYQGRVLCFDVSQGGRIVWSKDFSSASGISVDDRLLFASSQNSEVFGFMLEDGTTLWHQDALRNRGLTAPQVKGGVVAVGDYDGYVHFLDRADGHLLGRVSLGGGAIVSPLQASYAGVLVQTGNGKLSLLSVN
ncbi:outer membrane protein assembly factor BamB [Kerstersia similis]|uniref:outer membrane protein assembly factor BamB n=1 Tax=Kerstersia similis TaxID=206505 RepID=UPI0039F03E2A